MSERKDNPLQPGMAATGPLFEWWTAQWLQGSNPVARMQLAWMESLADAMQFEAQFLQAMAKSGQRMANSFDKDNPEAAADMQARYQEMMEEITDAHMKRLQKAADLSHEFRRRVWEEI
ncbi:hypothetical protein [Halomonas cerina]|uniref:DNA anti-recombination protein RmuC n=1 Tax=Halomonas cerina TaxID=447424 RepID=A0A839VCW3_9GAMM|nr:hypothetical protein [Halomonas cerina]MBB3191855.1 DNA anti-recombination protein RmuC [Halomonas cerina]